MKANVCLLSNIDLKYILEQKERISLAGLGVWRDKVLWSNW